MSERPRNFERSWRILEYLRKNSDPEHYVTRAELLNDPVMHRYVKGKETFNDDDEYRNRFNYIKTVELLLIDDIGAETTTSWSRDEILGTILQYRMQAKLPTFFTSNFTIQELEEHLSLANNSIEKVKARRIIERIKQLSEVIVMISENKRKWG